METAKAAPTGCYKCGRPGHWSRDCPDSNLNPETISNSKFIHSNTSRSFAIKPSNSDSKSVAEKPKKVSRTRPKLTPEILLGDDGLGYVLRHFPRNFKYRGRGHEAEQVASTKRVKMCLRDLRERVAGGGDPTKLHELPTEQVGPNLEQDQSTPDETVGLHHNGGPSLGDYDAEVMQEGMLHEIYDRATEEPARTSHIGKELPTQNSEASLSNEVLITDEQRARMEANRLKALETAAARARSLQSS